MIMERDLYHNFLLFASLLLLLIPPALVSGPFLPDLFIVFISIIYLFFFNSMKEFKLFKNIFFRLFILFYLYLVLTSLLSDHFNESIRSSITYIRFGLFSLAVYFLFKNNNKLIKYFYLVVYFTIIVLLIDGYYQFFTGKNIFGYKVIRPDRLGGLFFDELILGSYLSKILPIFCTFYYLNKNNLNKYNIFIIIFLVYLLIFLSGERSAFLNSTLYIFMIAPFFLNFRNIILTFITLIIVVGSLVAFNENIKSRYYDQMIMHTINSTNQSEQNFLPEHMGLFSSAIKIFKKNIFFGDGVKTYRINCNSKKYDNDIDLSKLTEKRNKNCSTHPHNFYLQLLAETGIFGFLFIFLIFLKLFYDYFKKLYFFLKRTNYINKSNVLILSGLITFLWPITTTGSFFNNWICSILFLQLGIYLYTINSNYKKNES